MAWEDIGRWKKMWPHELAIELGLDFDIAGAHSKVDAYYVTLCYELSWKPANSFESSEDWYKFLAGPCFELLHDLRPMWSRMSEGEQWEMGMRCPACGRLKHNIVPSDWQTGEECSPADDLKFTIKRVLTKKGYGE